MIGLGFMTEAKAEGKSSARDIRDKSRALVRQAMTDYARDDVAAAHGHMQEATFLCKGASISARPAFEWLMKGFDPGLASILHRDAKGLKVVLSATGNPIAYLDAVVDLDDSQGAALLAAYCPTGYGDEGTSSRYQAFILRALASKNPALAGAIFGALPADISWLNLRKRDPLPVAPVATTPLDRDAMKAAFNATFAPNP